MLKVVCLIINNAYKSYYLMKIMRVGVFKFYVVLTKKKHSSSRLKELKNGIGFIDVALVTSLRDGMNLVSYEFIACQNFKKGVLILSEVNQICISIFGLK